jgi:hypothetical protein
VRHRPAQSSPRCAQRHHMCDGWAMPSHRVASWLQCAGIQSSCTCVQTPVTDRSLLQKSVRHGKTPDRTEHAWPHSGAYRCSGCCTEPHHRVPMLLVLAAAATSDTRNCRHNNYMLANLQPTYCPSVQEPCTAGRRPADNATPLQITGQANGIAPCRPLPVEAPCFTAGTWAYILQRERGMFGTTDASRQHHPYARQCVDSIFHGLVAAAGVVQCVALFFRLRCLPVAPPGAGAGCWKAGHSLSVGPRGKEGAPGESHPA